MPEDRMNMLFFELFSGLPRQGPGDRASTLKALSLIPGVGSHTRILDLGCGTGAQTIALAESSSAHLVAVDNHPPFVNELRRRAATLALGDRVDARTDDMLALSFPDGSFDIVWCEGAIFVAGFDDGLRMWRPLLVPGGHLAVTEVCWTRPDVPAELAKFWSQEYSAISDVPTVTNIIGSCGYDVAGHFSLPSSAWWDEYYAPLEQNIAAFRKRHDTESDAQTLADGVQREIEIWKEYSDYYSYEFFVMRRNESA